MDTSTIAANPFKKPAVVDAQVGQPAPMEEGEIPVNPFGSPDSEDDFSFDLTHSQTQAVIAPNRYAVVCTDVSQQISQNSGNNMWVFTFTILKNADGSDTPFAGRTIKKYCAITPAAEGILINTVEALGLGKTGEPMRFKKADAQNRLAILNVTAGTYNGNPSANAGNMSPWNPVGQKYSGF